MHRQLLREYAVKIKLFLCGNRYLCWNAIPASALHGGSQSILLNATQVLASKTYICVGSPCHELCLHAHSCTGVNVFPMPLKLIPEVLH